MHLAVHQGLAGFEHLRDAGVTGESGMCTRFLGSPGRGAVRTAGSSGSSPDAVAAGARKPLIVRAGAASRSATGAPLLCTGPHNEHPGLQPAWTPMMLGCSTEAHERQQAPGCMQATAFLSQPLSTVRDTTRTDYELVLRPRNPLTNEIW